MSEVAQDLSTLTVRLERELLTRFQIVVIRQQKSMSQVVRDFIEWYVAKEEG